MRTTNIFNLDVRISEVWIIEGLVLHSIADLNSSFSFTIFIYSVCKSEQS